MQWAAKDARLVTMAASTGVTQTSTPSPTSVLTIAFGPDKAAEVEAHVRDCFAAAYEASELFGAAIRAAREAELQAARLFAEANEQKQLAVTLGVMPARHPGRVDDSEMPPSTFTLGNQLNRARGLKTLDANYEQPVAVGSGGGFWSTTPAPAPKTPLQVAQALVEAADELLAYNRLSLECGELRRTYLELLCEARQWFALSERV